MKLIKKIWGNTALLTLNGTFDGFACNPFLEQTEFLESEKVLFIVVNMDQVDFINSTGIGCLIKCRKSVKASGGDLVISMPADQVVETLDNLGLTEVLKSFESDEAALAYFDSGEGIEMAGSNNILIHLPGEERPPLIGVIRKLEENRIIFETDETRLQKIQGTDVRLKFRLPLFKKSHYFDVKAKITKMVHAATGTLINADIIQLTDEDRTSIAQFVQDMRFLRKEAQQ